jgi:5-oxoprolinase (ATP-hydrolysing) subunit A
VREYFADRGYRPDGTLVPRSDERALVTDPAVVAERVSALLDHGCVIAVDGSRVEVSADSICVHGDTDRAVALADAVTATLASRDIAIRPFA